MRPRRWRRKGPSCASWLLLGLGVGSRTLGTPCGGRIALRTGLVLCLATEARRCVRRYRSAVDIRSALRGTAWRTSPAEAGLAAVVTVVMAADVGQGAHPLLLLVVVLLTGPL